jgi:hypothetical protein
LTPARATAPSARSIAGRSRAIGFSQKTCLPAAAASAISAACVSVLEQITTAASSGRASSSR